ncbi:hypothetical protein C8A00DRAFT_36063 [Chaetomidium leptoderma]|uniref:Uncharacterized protein n=1 Tax=Chaetomidium leptoderma TaxID=669021 RepID=A0AAN6VJE4_9PEZI|nr:hypothetical protein C8A00DRAFT_36063 [Chaetomidium leptoderma]
MKSSAPSATPGGPGSSGTAQPAAAASAAPLTPCPLAGLHPGDARHEIMEIRRRSGGWSTGSQRELQLPSTSSGSPLADRAKDNLGASGGGTIGQGAKKRTAKGAAARGREGQGDNGEQDGEPQFTKVNRLLFRASDLMPESPSGPSGMPTPAAHRTANDEHGTESGGGGPLRLSPSGASGVSGLAAPGPTHQMSGDGVGTEASDVDPNPPLPRAPTPESKAADDELGTESEMLLPAAAYENDNLLETGEINSPSTRTEAEPELEDTAALDAGEQIGAPNESSEECEMRVVLKRSASAPPFDSANIMGRLQWRPNKKLRLDDLDVAMTGLASGVSTPGPQLDAIHALFPSVPLCYDSDAVTGRVWCPLNMRNEFDPHWKEWPKNWNHPKIPGEGTCDMSDVLGHDSAAPEMVHECIASHASKGTLFSATMENLAAATATIDECGYDPVNDPLEIKISKSHLQQLQSQPFLFPATGTNPFTGARLPRFGDMCLNSLYRPSSQPNPLPPGVDVPPVLPSTNFRGAKFIKENNILRIPKEWWQSVTPGGELGTGLVGFSWNDEKENEGEPPVGDADIGFFFEEFCAAEQQGAAGEKEGDGNHPKAATKIAAGIDRSPEDAMEVEQPAQASPTMSPKDNEHEGKESNGDHPKAAMEVAAGTDRSSEVEMDVEQPAQASPAELPSAHQTKEPSDNQVNTEPEAATEQEAHEAETSTTPMDIDQPEDTETQTPALAMEEEEENKATAPTAANQPTKQATQEEAVVHTSTSEAAMPHPPPPTTTTTTQPAAQRSSSIARLDITNLPLSTAASLHREAREAARASMSAPAYYHTSPPHDTTTQQQQSHGTGTGTGTTETSSPAGFATLTTQQTLTPLHEEGPQEGEGDGRVVVGQNEGREDDDDDENDDDGGGGRRRRTDWPSWASSSMDRFSQG